MSSQASPLNLSNSFSWPALSGSKVKQTHPEKSDKMKQKKKNGTRLSDTDSWFKYNK